MLPSVCAGYGSRSSDMPSSPATRITSVMPTSTPICANTELTDLFIASWTGISP